MGFETGKTSEYCKFKKIGYKIAGIFYYENHLNLKAWKTWSRAQ